MPALVRVCWLFHKRLEARTWGALRDCPQESHFGRTLQIEKLLGLSREMRTPGWNRAPHGQLVSQCDWPPSLLTTASQAMVHALLRPRSTYEGTAMWHGPDGPWVLVFLQGILLIGKAAFEYWERRWAKRRPPRRPKARPKL